MAEEVREEAPDVGFVDKKFGKKAKVGNDGKKEGALSRLFWIGVGAVTFVGVQEFVRRRRGDEMMRIPRGFTADIKPLPIFTEEEIEV